MIMALSYLSELSQNTFFHKKHTLKLNKIKQQFLEIFILRQLHNDFVDTNLNLTLRVDRACQFNSKAFELACKDKGINLEFCSINIPNDKPTLRVLFLATKKKKFIVIIMMIFLMLILLGIIICIGIIITYLILL